MKKALLAAVLAWLLSGCGASEQNSPCGWGSEQTNVVACAEVLPESLEVDLCNSASAMAIANITTRIVNPDLPENTLYVESYHVDYRPLTADAPPVAGNPVFPLGVELPASNVELLFFDNGRKATLLEDLSSGLFSIAVENPAYAATYTFFGRDDYGSDFGAVGGFTFRAGRFSNTMSLHPQSISIQGGTEVTFHILCGAGPYTVYSDNSVISSPGQLAPGATTFPVIPSAVSSATEVILTVLDKNGKTALALVMVNP